MPTFDFQFPLARTHAGIALGNGLLGVLVWGERTINITLNRADFWDHRGGYRPTPGVTTYAHLKQAYDPADPGWSREVFPRDPGAGRPSRLPFGRFELRLRRGCRPVRGELDPATGALTVRLSGPNVRAGAGISFDLDLRGGILWLDDPHRLVSRIGVRTAWQWVGGELRALGFPEPALVEETGAWGWAQACPADPALAAVCRPAGAGGYKIATARGATAAAAVKEADRLLARAGDPAAARAANAAWWRAYWKDAPRISVPDPFFNRFIRYGLYKFAAATHPACPWPAGLQGPWVEEYQWPPWNADYHFNVNVQQVYTLALAANRPAHLVPLFDWLDARREVLRRNARVVCGIDDGLILGMCVDDRAEMLYPGAGVLMDHACSGWVAQLYWWYYLYTGDADFLRRRAYPFMHGVMRVYEEMLEAEDGRLSLPLGISAEFGNDIAPRYLGRNPSYQLACIHMLAGALLEAARVLKTAPRPAWQKIQSKLPPFTLAGPPDAPRIAIWEGQDLDFCHRHHSHLAGIYPFDTLDADSPATREIIDNSIDHWVFRGMGKWSEWCMPWAAIIQARLGFSDAPWAILQLWRRLFVNEGLATVYIPRFRGLSTHRRELLRKPLETCEIMQIDGTAAGVTAICEMMAHRRGDTIRLFYGVPDDWRNFSFANIRLPGAFLVAARRRNHALEYIRIKSLAGGPLKLQVRGIKSLTLVRKNRAPAPARLPLRLATRPGETITLRPSDRVHGWKPEAGPR